MKHWILPPNLMESFKESNEPVQLSSRYTRTAHDKEINCIASAPNDKLIVSGAQDRVAKIWRTKDGELVGSFKGHRRGVWDAKFSPFDQVVATASVFV